MSNFIVRFPNGGNVNLSATVHAALVESGFSASRAYAMLAPLVTDGTLVYSRNVGQARTPWPMDAPLNLSNVHGDYRDRKRMGRKDYQHMRCMAQVYALLRKHREDRDEHRDEDREQREDEQRTPPPSDEQDEQAQDEDEGETHDERDERDGSSDHPFLKWVMQVQAYQKSNDEREWGYRQAKNGAKLLKAGMPMDAIKDAMLIDADDEMRHVLGVRPFDMIAWGASIAREDETALEAVIGVTMKAGIPACAVGGAGIGKTHTFEAVAAREGASIAVISCNEDGIRPDVFGTLTPGIREGYVLAEVADAMLKAESGEKTFVLLDEMDALVAADALKLNRALEQRKIAHPFLGRTIDFGANVQFFAAMNTTGQGADEDFTGRDKQDAAFLDRFFRFRVTRDDDVQRAIFAAEIA